MSVCCLMDENLLVVLELATQQTGHLSHMIPILSHPSFPSFPRFPPGLIWSRRPAAQRV